MDNFIYLLSVDGLGTGTRSLFELLARTMGALVLVVLLLYVFVKVMAASRGGFRRGVNLSIIENVSVGQQAVVSLVRAGEKYLVIGVTKERITLLSELDAQDLTLAEENDKAGAETPPFISVLSKFLPQKTDVDWNELNKDEKSDDEKID